MALRLFSLADREAPALHLLGLIGSILGASLALAGVAAAGPLLLLFGLLLLAIGLTSVAGASALQRHVDTEPTGWRGPGPILLFSVTLVWAVVAGALIGLIVGVLDGSPGGVASGAAAIDPSLSVFVYVVASALMSTAVIALLVVGTGAARWRDLFGAPPEERSGRAALPMPLRSGGAIGDAAWGAVLVLPALVTALLLAWTLTEQSGVTPDAPIAPISPGAPGAALQLALSVLAAVVVAPISEELLYRGVIARAWGRQSGTRRAIVLSTILFAFAHTIGVGGANTSEALIAAGIAFFVRVPLGIAAGWLWVRRRSLLAPIVLHALYNLAILALSNAG